MWQDVPGLPLNRKPGDYMSISGQRVPYYSLQPSVACSSHNPGCMSPGLQVYVNTEVIPVAMPAYDRQMLTEQGRLSQEDVMQQKLRLQGRKVESLTRQLVKKSSQKEEDPLWRDVRVTAQDLEPISKRRQEWEDHLWRVWDRENKHSRTTAAQTVDQLKSARETLATKRGQVSFRKCL